MKRLRIFVFVPFLGDFLSISGQSHRVCAYKFSSPFLGTFFQYAHVCWYAYGREHVFVPFLGDFLSIVVDGAGDVVKRQTGFRPLSWGLSFNSVPAKPQPVCSRKRIRGGDEGIASSGTLLRR